MTIFYKYRLVSQVAEMVTAIDQQFTVFTQEASNDDGLPVLAAATGSRIENVLNDMKGSP